MSIRKRNFCRCFSLKTIMDRQKLASVRNFIKSENGRLTSLALPRDLSLGGSKQKKVYTPNLNVVRNKNKPKEYSVD